MNSAGNWLGALVVIVVLSVWAGAYVYGMYDRTYQPPRGLTEVMAAVAGFVLTGKFIFSARDQQRRQDRQDDEDAANDRAEKPRLPSTIKPVRRSKRDEEA